MIRTRCLGQQITPDEYLTIASLTYSALEVSGHAHGKLEVREAREIPLQEIFDFLRVNWHAAKTVLVVKIDYGHSAATRVHLVLHLEPPPKYFDSQKRPRPSSLGLWKEILETVLRLHSGNCLIRRMK